MDLVDDSGIIHHFKWDKRFETYSRTMAAFPNFLKAIVAKPRARIFFSTAAIIMCRIQLTKC